MLGTPCTASAAELMADAHMILKRLLKVKDLKSAELKNGVFSPTSVRNKNGDGIFTLLRGNSERQTMVVTDCSHGGLPMKTSVNLLLSCADYPFTQVLTENLGERARVCDLLDIVTVMRKADHTLHWEGHDGEVTWQDNEVILATWT